MKCLSIKNNAKCCYGWTAALMNRQARWQGNLNKDYGNTGSRVFKRGTKLEKKLHKNQHIKRKLLNFENWCNGEVSKIANIWLSKSIFYVKNHLNLSLFFSLKDNNLGAHFLFSTFLITSIFKSLYYLNDAQFLKACHYTNPQNSIIFFGYVDS